MARYVREIMSAELFSLKPSEPVGNARLAILGLGLTAAPVVDAQERPMGVVSLRDLTSGDDETVGVRMSAPAVTVRAEAEIRDTAVSLAEQNRHRFVVVAEDGRAVGVVSALDLLRAVLDLPAQHPAGLARRAHQGVRWSDPFPISVGARGAPYGPGVFMLVHDEVGEEVKPLWAEATANVRARLDAILAAPHEQVPRLRQLVQRDRAHLRVRVASISDPRERAAVLEQAIETTTAAAH